MSDLVGNPEDRFSRVAAHMDFPIVIIFGQVGFHLRSDFQFLFPFLIKFFIANRIAQDGTSHLRHPIRGYTFCLCPITDVRLK